MMIGLLEQARKDAQMVVSGGGFEQQLTLTTPDGQNTITVKGLHTGRTEVLDDGQGKPVISLMRHIAVHEADLVAAGYPVRNTAGLVALNNHHLDALDNTGTMRHYMVTQCHPNQTTGLIMCQLGIRKV